MLFLKPENMREKKSNWEFNTKSGELPELFKGLLLLFEESSSEGKVRDNMWQQFYASSSWRKNAVKMYIYIGWQYRVMQYLFLLLNALTARVEEHNSCELFLCLSQLSNKKEMARIESFFFLSTALFIRMTARSNSPNSNCHSLSTFYYWSLF